jgi:hypothetical protein
VSRLIYSLKFSVSTKQKKYRLYYTSETKNIDGVSGMA